MSIYCIEVEFLILINFRLKWFSSQGPRHMGFMFLRQPASSSLIHLISQKITGCSHLENHIL